VSAPLWRRGCTCTPQPCTCTLRLRRGARSGEGGNGRLASAVAVLFTFGDCVPAVAAAAVQAGCSLRCRPSSNPHAFQPKHRCPPPTNQLPHRRPSPFHPTTPAGSASVVTTSPATSASSASASGSTHLISWGRAAAGRAARGRWSRTPILDPWCTGGQGAGALALKAAGLHLRAAGVCDTAG
jgi:hypothetical protein